MLLQNIIKSRATMVELKYTVAISGKEHASDCNK